DLPPDRRVAMARLCSMIRRSARGVRESMRYGLAFYELDGPLFALESARRHMSLYVAEKDVVLKHKDALQGVNANKSFIKFSDLNRLPLDVVEKIVRDSVAARRQRLAQGTVPTQAELLKLWGINEEAAAPPATTVKLPTTKPAASMTDAINAMANSVRDAMIAAIDIATGAPAPKAKSVRKPATQASARAAKRTPSRASTRTTTRSSTAKKASAKKAARRR
ncbi:MAG: arylesterase, partial [Burkholderiaceae bacterium]|nr:arylesterase [Burkholderiaceae bacterium]